jgi:hypothetical protein
MLPQTLLVKGLEAAVDEHDRGATRGRTRT